MNNEVLREFNPFHECDFINLFFTLLLEKGITVVDKTNLFRKLAYYYKKEEYKNIFSYTTIKKNIFHDEVNLDTAIFMNFLSYGLIKLSAIDRNAIYLDNKPYDKNKIKRLLNEDDYQRIIYMADEIANLLNIERTASYPVCIYPTLPNKEYITCEGVNKDYYKWDIITDGFITKAMHFNDLMTIAWCYDSPLDMNRVIKLKKGNANSVVLENGTYALLRGMVNNRVTRSEIYTTISDKKILGDIINLANVSFLKNTNVVRVLKK